jgi:hypothetical protein
MERLERERSEIKMTDLQSDVWQFLLERFVGVENATRRETILARYNLIKKKELTDRVFRKVVSILVKDFKKAICTHPEKGYYVARTEREKTAALNYLDSVIGEVAQRRRDLAEADPMEKQERLFERGEGVG